MVIKRHKGPISIGEVWFEPAAPRQCDVVFYVQQSNPVGGVCNVTKRTILVDLNQSEEAIHGGMKADTRYELRRACQQDKTLVHFHEQPNRATYLRFLEFYQEFAASKELKPLKRWYADAFWDHRVLMLSEARTPEGRSLSWHSYLAAGGRARLLHSASLFRLSESAADRNLIGRANRLHHFEDMLAFKRRGFATYDFGGWHTATGNEALKRINRFKEGFGGYFASEYNAVVPRSLLGKIAIRLKSY